MLRFALRDHEHVSGSGECGEHDSYPDVLIIGQNAFGAMVTAVIDEVVGVPSGAAAVNEKPAKPLLHLCLHSSVNCGFSSEIVVDVIS